MITFPILLFLAQAAVLAESSHTPHSAETHPSARHPRLHTSRTPPPTPEVRITIVNAMSCPSISLSTSGVNGPAAYPCFPQGEWTDNEPISTPVVNYLVRGTNGAILSKQSVHYKPVSKQFLVLTGDLSTKGPADRLPTIADSLMLLGAKPWPPNLQFHLFPYTLVSHDPCHYRIFNGMPGKSLLLRTVADGNKPPQQLALLAPGNSVALQRQPASIDYDVEIDGQCHRVEIRQEGAVGNCLIPFFLRNGKPDFIRVFETP